MYARIQKGVTFNCGSNTTTAISVGADCMYRCDERPTSNCASRCLNEDYPCRWVPNCHPPKGLEWHNFVCLRGCNDHDKFVQGLQGGQDCAETKANRIFLDSLEKSKRGPGKLDCGSFQNLVDSLPKPCDHSGVSAPEDLRACCSWLQLFGFSQQNFSRLYLGRG